MVDERRDFVLLSRLLTLLRLSSSLIKIAGLALGIFMLGSLGFLMWNRTPAQPAPTENTTAACTNSLVLSLARQDNSPTPRACIVGKFVVSDTETVTVAEVLFGGGGGKSYLVNSADQIIQTAGLSSAWLDLSLGSSVPACKYLWTNDIWTIEQTKPERIKRTLAKNGSTYLWKFELTNFNGDLPRDPKPHGCTRTGAFSVNFDGSDLKIIGTPTFQM